MELQTAIVEAGTDVFGAASMTDPHERLLRFLEEAIELVRVGGLSREQVDRIVEFEFSRAKGRDLWEEIGGAACTLYAVANAFGVSLEHRAREEMLRVKNNKARMREKAAAKPDHVFSTRCL